ncbi:phosphatidylglycerophosphatase C [Candidatus Erwinia haradaeae]|uniref:Phosphatidylglycerophosphatase C n=1 Tax=Candidatus Erwinia haradaeae TaxID=1922217 RepID=A0A451D1X8_9GAMM|nr:phosphatidylglycerophosphatase C [Candidatus Erwinia haradaeae]VFP79625.1 Phosphatidylglycerophosphatase C [Candidatus Erwinia haradaeae]
MVARLRRRIVFFDLDGTLHKQDIFSSFIYWLLWRHPLNILLCGLLLPLVGLGLLIYGRATRWPISILLWSMTFGHRESVLLKREEQFTFWFSRRLTIFQKVHQQLIEYLQDEDVDIWLITGSPQSLVEKIYCNIILFKQVTLVASQMKRAYGGRVLFIRCVGKEKVFQLTKRIGHSLQLESGYSDSKQDDYLLFFCANRFRVTRLGEIRKLESLER